MAVNTVKLVGAPILQVPTLTARVVAGPNAGLHAVAGFEMLSVGTAEGNDLVLTDDAVSTYHIELQRVERGVRVVDHGSTNGTQVSNVYVERCIVPSGSMLNLGRTVLQVGQGPHAQIAMHPEDGLGDLRGRSKGMRRLMARVKKAAPADISVLVVGESGTGKELVARAIHKQSGRCDGPFVTVDCGAISPGLITSELFGHERGAFTGAGDAHVGAFERARGGTVFLDEIGELPTDLQTHLLGVLERRAFRRLGGSKDISTDVRIVAATNRELRNDVNTGKFRLDLYYRLAVASLKVPPLRERTEDIPVLIEHFLRAIGFDGGVQDVFRVNSLAQLSAHHWPGNVRELRNLVEASVVMGESVLEHEVGGSGQPSPAPSDGELVPYKLARDAMLRQFEFGYLKKLIGVTGGNVAKASRLAKMNRSHLFDLLRRHKLR